MKLINFTKMIFQWNGNNIDYAMTYRKNEALPKLLQYTKTSQLKYIKDMIKYIQIQLNNGNECDIKYEGNNKIFSEKEFNEVIKNINLICTHRNTFFNKNTKTNWFGNINYTRTAENCLKKIDSLLSVKPQVMKNTNQYDSEASVASAPLKAIPEEEQAGKTQQSTVIANEVFCKELDKNASMDMDISNKYLNSDSKYFLFRTKDSVYAKEKKTGATAHMWYKANIKQGKSSTGKTTRLGQGQFGIVHARGNTKAIKKYKHLWGGMQQEEKLLINEQLLDMKFKLVKEGIDKHFIIGLHNPQKKYFTMPLIKNSTKQSSTKKSKKDFTLALKKFNELGFFHPDLHMSPNHLSPQNQTTNDDGIIVTFDIDESPLLPNTKPMNKDQWIWHAIYDHHGNYKTKRKEVLQYYNKHNYNKCISDDQEFLDSLNIFACYEDSMQ